MAAMITRRCIMESVLNQLRNRFPDLHFCEGSAFVWSPETQEVIYKTNALNESATWSLLHETSHALLNHTAYGTDFELLKLEVLAWEKAKILAAELELEISDDHIQDCLDTYRDWINARSICPQCNIKSIQQADLRHYRCFNCHKLWRVSTSRFCRAYRATKHTNAQSSDALDTFAAI